MDELLQQLLALGTPGGVIFVAYILFNERKQGREDRAKQIAEHNAEIAEQEARHRSAVNDMQASIARLRDELRRCREGSE